MPLELHWTERTGDFASKLHSAWEKTDALRAEMLQRAALQPEPPRMTLSDLEILAPTLA